MLNIFLYIYTIIKYLQFKHIQMKLKDIQDYFDNLPEDALRTPEHIAKTTSYREFLNGKIEYIHAMIDYHRSNNNVRRLEFNCQRIISYELILQHLDNTIEFEDVDTIDL